MENLEKYRADTPGVAQYIHLNNAGAGLMPLPVSEAIKEYIDIESQMGGYEAAAFKANHIQQFYPLMGAFLNCDASNIAFTTNATDSYIRALGAIPFQSGDIILTTRHDYASNQIAFLQLKKRFGVKILHAANQPSGGVDPGHVEELIQKHRPVLVAVTHVPTYCGLIQPIEEVGKICAKYDILYLIDACQSVGQLPVDIATIHCDFLTATFRKFLRGPRGAGFLYVSDRALQKGLEPLFVDMLGGKWTASNQYEISTTATRFELWEKSYALVSGSIAALKYAMEVELPPIARRITKLTNYCREKIQELEQFDCYDLDKGPMAGILTFNSKKESTEVLKKYLQSNRVNCSATSLEAALMDYEEKQIHQAVRISPHYYNTLAEINRFIDLLKNF